MFTYVGVLSQCSIYSFSVLLYASSRTYGYTDFEAQRISSNIQANSPNATYFKQHFESNMISLNQETSWNALYHFEIAICGRNSYSIFSDSVI